MPFVRRRMVSNDEPYKSLAGLRKAIDNSPDIDSAQIVSELEKLHEALQALTFARTIGKPKILYSLMISP